MKKADDGIPRTVAPIEEVQLYVRDASGKRVDVSFHELVEKTMGKSLPRADLHISRSRDGELFLTSRQDGMIRMLVPDSGAGTTSAKRWFGVHPLLLSSSQTTDQAALADTEAAANRVDEAAGVDHVVRFGLAQEGLRKLGLGQVVLTIRGVEVRSGAPGMHIEHYDVE